MFWDEAPCTPVDVPRGTTSGEVQNAFRVVWFLLVYWLAYLYILNLEAARFFETFVDSYRTTPRYIAGDIGTFMSDYRRGLDW
jgi:hypothetical protein